MLHPPRLLVLACSATKRPDDALPAVDRYDGPAFRTVRKYLRTDPVDAPDLWILSAEHGLIHGSTHILPYDRRMTPARADDLRERVEPALDALAAGRPACLALGRLYHRAAGGAAMHATRTAGGQGTQLAALRRWLGAAPEPMLATLPVRFQNLADVSPGAVVRLAAQRAPADPASARLGAYAATAGSLRVAPKWLVTQLSGVPVAQFRTADALRVLAHIGIPVEPA